MKLRVIKIGRIAYPEIRALAAMYEERLRPLAQGVQVESLELKEGADLMRHLLTPANEHLVVALDELGKEWTSVQLAQDLQKRADDPSIKSLTFLIGGPLGLTPLQRQQARLTWCLSKATLTSDLACLILWEQLYRAYNILRGTGYHHM